MGPFQGKRLDPVPRLTAREDRRFPVGWQLFVQALSDHQAAVLLAPWLGASWCSLSCVLDRCTSAAPFSPPSGGHLASENPSNLPMALRRWIVGCHAASGVPGTCV